MSFELIETMPAGWNLIIKRGSSVVVEHYEKLKDALKRIKELEKARTELLREFEELINEEK